MSCQKFLILSVGLDNRPSRKCLALRSHHDVVLYDTLLGMTLASMNSHAGGIGTPIIEPRRNHIVM
jgi:hypothetical protein